MQIVPWKVRNAKNRRDQQILSQVSREIPTTFTCMKKCPTAPKMSRLWVIFCGGWSISISSWSTGEEIKIKQQIEDRYASGSTFIFLLRDLVNSSNWPRQRLLLSCLQARVWKALPLYTVNLTFVLVRHYTLTCLCFYGIRHTQQSKNSFQQ